MSGLRSPRDLAVEVLRYSAAAPDVRAEAIGAAVLAVGLDRVQIARELALAGNDADKLTRLRLQLTGRVP